MEEEFLNLGLDIIGLGVFNYKFGSITTESPVIKASLTSRHNTTWPALTSPSRIMQLVTTAQGGFCTARACSSAF